MSAQIGHIEAPAPVLGHDPRSAEIDLKRRRTSAAPGPIDGSRYPRSAPEPVRTVRPSRGEELLRRQQ